MLRNFYLFIALIAIGAMISCNSGKKTSTAVALETNKDSASYSVGVQIATNFVSQGMDTIMNTDLIAAGIKDVFDKNAKIGKDEANKIAQAFFNEMQKSEHQPKIEEGRKFLAENAKREGIQTTESGLQYEVLEEGAGKTPTAQSVIKAHYEGRLIDGTVFDSSIQRGEPATFPVNGVIKGWQEALQMMKVGAKWRIYVPYDLGYGSRGAGKMIKPYETLVFDIELISIEEMKK